MKNYFKLFRWQNLLMIIATFYILRYCIAGAILKVNGYSFVFSDVDFALLVLSVVLIAAGGYVINYYFDTEADQVNGRFNPVGSTINANTAVALYLVLSVLGFLVGLYLSIKVGHAKFSLIYFIAASLLWFYSASFKKSFLLGNLIVAFLVSLIPLLIAIYDVPLLLVRYHQDAVMYGINFNVITLWMLGYSAFAFGFTLLREITKDLQDIEGDISVGANTLPIVLGQSATKVLLILLDLGLIAGLIWIFVKYLNHIWSLIYLSLFLILPNLVFIFQIFRAKTVRHYKQASDLLKIIMILGITYAFLACYIFSKL